MNAIAEGPAISFLNRISFQSNRLEIIVQTNLTRILTIIILVLLVSGCSGNGSPLEPEVCAPPEGDLQLTGESVSESGDQSRYIWAYYNIMIDPDEGKLEVVTPRQITGHWNVLRFLDKTPCGDCLKLSNLQLTGPDEISIDVTIRHPFDNPDLTGFDVRGIVMFNGYHIYPETDVCMSDYRLGNPELMNADGYTTMYRPETYGSGPDGLQGYQEGDLATQALPTGTLNAFIRYRTQDINNTRYAFYAGDEVTRSYVIRMPDGPLYFGYAVDACWVPPTVSPVTEPMTDFPPDANCSEAFDINIEHDPIGKGLTELGGQAQVFIGISDWQGATTIKNVRIECPELFDGTRTAVFMNAQAYLADYAVIIQNENQAPEGTYRLLVSVEDKDNDQSPEWLDFIAYQIYEIEVIYNGHDPVAGAETDPDPPVVSPGDFVHFYDASTDPEGEMNIVEWKWDFDYNEVDGFEVMSEDQDPQFKYDTQGIFYVQLVVTDAQGNSDELDEPIKITVGDCLGNHAPVAAGHIEPSDLDPGIVFEFFDDSYDEDGASDIISWEWDLNYHVDVGFTPDKNASHFIYEYQIPGEYLVMLRVTDKCGETDFIDEPLQVTVDDCVGNLKPFAGAYTDLEGPIKPFETFYLHDDSYDSDDPVLLYEWDLSYEPSVGFIPELYVKNSYQQYDENGTYLIQHRVTDHCGEQDMLEEPIEVVVDNCYENNPPEAYFTGNWIYYDIAPGEVICMLNNSEDDDGNHTIVSYEWDFTYVEVDGFQAENYEFEPCTSYPDEGEYKIMLRVTDECGDTDTNVIVLTVSDCADNNPPAAIASTDPAVTDLCPGETVYFYDESQDADGIDDIVKWEWDFSYIDGEGFNVESEEQNPGHQFNEKGNWLVQLRVTDACGEERLLYEPILVTVWDYQYAWGGAWGSDDDYEELNDMSVDSTGNAYVCGDYWDGIDFDHGPGIDWKEPLTVYNSYLSKTANDGSYQWTRTWHNFTNELIEIDCVKTMPDNSVLLTGRAAAEIDLDPGLTEDIHSFTTDYGIFLISLDTNGLYEWGIHWNAESAGFYAIDTDSAGNIYLGGYFYGTVDFDPGTGVEEYTSLGDMDAFLIKLDSGGVFQWARRWGADDRDYMQKIFCDPAGSVFVQGNSQSEVIDLNPGVGTDEHTPQNADYNSAFLIRLDSDGNYVWGFPWEYDYSHKLTGLALDSNGDIYLVGYYTLGIDLDLNGGSEFFTPKYNNYNAYMFKILSDSSFSWAGVWGPEDQSNRDYARAVHCDSSDNVLVVGLSYEYTDLDPGPGEFILDEDDSYLLYVSRFNTSGDFIDADFVATEEDIYTSRAEFNQNSDIYLTGRIYYSAFDLNPGDGMDFVSLNGDYDDCIRKFTICE